MPVTIKDIARKAGVSHTTVSRALNGNPAIPERTATVIRNLAQGMGYLPSAAARGLKTNRSHVLGVIVSRIDNPYFGEIVQGIEETLHNTGYSIFVASTSYDDARELATFRAFSEHRVDGVIIGSVLFKQRHAELLKQYGIPVVVINNQSLREFAYSISHDDLFGAREVTRHLIELGHRQIVYLGNRRARRINRDRSNGFCLEMQSAGIPVMEENILNMQSSEIEDGESGMNIILQRPQQPTAVFCFNDLMAIGALKVLQQHGLRVPQDLSLVGFDNIAYSAYTTPALTTFDQPRRLIGAEAASMLMSLINPLHQGNGQPEQEARTLRGSLLVRESTGLAPRKDKYK